MYTGYTSQRALMPPSERAKHAHRLRTALAEPWRGGACCSPVVESALEAPN